MVSASDRSVVRQLCADALAGDIGLDEFEARRPVELADPFLAQVLDDLEDAIVHTPGRILRRGTDHAAWERSPQYKTILVDWCLLDERASDVEGDELLRWRATIDAEPFVSRNNVRRKVDSLLRARRNAE